MKSNLDILGRTVRVSLLRKKKCSIIRLRKRNFKKEKSPKNLEESYTPISLEEFLISHCMLTKLICKPKMMHCSVVDRRKTCGTN